MVGVEFFEADEGSQRDERPRPLTPELYDNCNALGGRSVLNLTYRLYLDLLILNKEDTYLMPQPPFSNLEPGPVSTNLRLHNLHLHSGNQYATPSPSHAPPWTTASAYSELLILVSPNTTYPKYCLILARQKGEHTEK